jgi:hypothetical protein
MQVESLGIKSMDQLVAKYIVRTMRIHCVSNYSNHSCNG